MKTKRKIVSLVMALILVFSMAAIPGVAGAVINVPPVAQAGPDQAVHSTDIFDHAGPYPLVTLDGSGSFDQNPGDTISYSWTGPVALAGATTANPTFTPPGPGIYTFTLTVTDDGAPNLSDTDTVTVIAGLTWYVRMDIVTASDGNDGKSYDYTPIGYGPVRTITHAIDVLASDGDRIIVGPSTELEPYGGVGAPEVIDVDKWLTIWSVDGRDDTWIDVSGQDPLAQVVEISALWGAPYTWGRMGGVVFGSDGHGFSLTGAPVGIYAHDSDYVYIHQNYVLVDEESLPTGIAVVNCKAPIIDDNIVDVVDVAHGIGIDVWQCAASPSGGAEVTNNTVTVHATDWAEGIDVGASPKALVYNNTVVVTAVASLAWGIKLYAGSDLSQITWNDVNVEVHGETLGAGFGIKVMDSDRVTVAHNNWVDVFVSVRSGCLGGHLAVGILLKNSVKSDVYDNLVTVHGEGLVDKEVVDGGLGGGGTAALDAEDLADLELVIEEVTGSHFALALAGGLVLGIIAIDADRVDVFDNVVDADADMTLGATASHSLAIGGGAVLTLGITVLFSTAPQVTGNDVLADSDADIHVQALDVAAELETALGAGLAAGLGIVVAFCPPDETHGVAALVDGNEVEAYGDVYALVEAKDEVTIIGSVDSEAALGKLQTDVLSVVYDIVTESAENEEVDVQISGNPQSLTAIAGGGALGLGIGIMALRSSGAQITNNGSLDAESPVIGQGTVDVTIIAWDEVLSIRDAAVSLGGGLGLGIGILDAWSTPTEVSGNIAAGRGDATVDASGAEVPAEVDQSSAAIAAAGGGGIGLGILVIDPLSQAEAAEVNQEWDAPPSEAWVVGNAVDGVGSSNVITQAINRDPHTGAVALGASLAVGKGIVVVGVWAPVIAQNYWVNAQADANADVYASAISTVDPLALGVSAGIAVGIMVSASPFAEIHDNAVYAYGDADGMTTAIEEMVMADIVAVAGGTSLGVGIGIIVVNSGGTRVSWNYSEGDGSANVVVIAEQNEPLDEAWAWALGAGIGKGIVVAHLSHAWVQESNTFIGNGHVTVDASALGDYAHAAGLGLALGIDAFIVDVVAVAFNYNDMPVLDASTGSGPVLVIDLGMLILFADYVDARYNWWADPSGPSWFGPGFGQPIKWFDADVDYVPWLWGEHEWQLEAHIGKYGKYIELPWSWNTFSTPIALENPSWADILAVSGDPTGISAPLYWDAETDMWETATEIVPLTGYYVTVDEPTTLILLASTSTSMPTKELSEGWNLIGPNPAFCKPGMPVGDAITPVAYAEGGAGFSHVISNAPTQPNWSYTLLQWRNGLPGPLMQSGKAYWVWMNSDGTLSGFGFTPIGLYPDDP